MKEEQDTNMPKLEPIKEKSNRYEHLQKVYREAMEKAKGW